MMTFKRKVSIWLVIAIVVGTISAGISAHIWTKTFVELVKVEETTPSESPTLRDVLSKPTPMTSSFEVVDVVNGEYHLVDVSLDGNDQGTFILEGNYEVGDVVTVLWATEDSTEIAGDVLVGTASELDKQHCKVGCDK